MEAIDEFRERLYQEWLIPFCNRHAYLPEGFVNSSIHKLASDDARDFLAAIDDSLAVHENGEFHAPCSKASERIFWEGIKSSSPRKITLWIEPIITMAALSKLHHQYSWPKNQLGLQSKDWAFDLVAYSSKLDTEVIACEVKKTWAEVISLLIFMEKHKSSPDSLLTSTKGAERNAFKKIMGLRLCKAPIFWALGPKGESKVFKVEYDTDGTVILIPTTEEALIYINAINI